MHAAPCLVFKIVTYLNSLKPYSSMSETASKTCRKYMEILVVSSACLFGVALLLVVELEELSNNCFSAFFPSSRSSAAGLVLAFAVILVFVKPIR